MLPFQYIYIYVESGTNEKRQLLFVCCKQKTEVCFPWSANDKQ